MFNDPSYRYMKDGMFRAVVDMLRASLKEYTFTPTELREAVILAATMHDAQTIKPLFITKPFSGLRSDWVYMDEAPKFISLETVTGRFGSSKPNQSNTPQEIAKTPSRRSVWGDRRDHTRAWMDNRTGNYNRHQAKYVELGRENKTGDRRKKASKPERRVVAERRASIYSLGLMATRKDALGNYLWERLGKDRRKTTKVEPKVATVQRRVGKERRVPGSLNTRFMYDRVKHRRKAVPEHFHVFNYDGTHKDFKVCSCGVSDVYYSSLGQKK